MSFGLRTWNASSQLELDTTTFTYQVLYNEIITFAGATSRQSRNLVIPGFSTANCCFLLLPTSETPGFGGIQDAAPFVIPGSGAVTVRNWHPNETNLTRVSRQTVRGMAIRYTT